MAQTVEAQRQWAESQKPLNGKNIIIFDLDGTLALIDHRRHFVDKSSGVKVDWNAFFEACDKDEPNTPVILANRLVTGYHIIILSGRSEAVREKTIRWLARHEVYYDELRMRAEGDYQPDETLKEAWLKQIGPDNIICVYDDRDKVVAMWRKNGVTCFQVAPGNF